MGVVGANVPTTNNSIVLSKGSNNCDLYMIGSIPPSLRNIGYIAANASVRHFQGFYWWVLPVVCFYAHSLISPGVYPNARNTFCYIYLAYYSYWRISLIFWLFSIRLNCGALGIAHKIKLTYFPIISLIGLVPGLRSRKERCFHTYWCLIWK